jgi:drug/metabolite transporter (DMT)-like permease
MFFISAFGSAIAYGTDAIFGKLALNDMPLEIFIFLLAVVYSFIAVGMFVIYRKSIYAYFVNNEHLPAVAWAVVAIIVGTVIADILMWKAINLSKTWQLPITVAIIHTAPIFSLVFVILYYKQSINIKAIAGICLTVIGCALMIINSGEDIKTLT